jgi:hypothetical protein
MKESFIGDTNSENLIKSTIEKTANYEGDHTLLLKERLDNQDVKNKLVDSLTKEYIFRYYKADPKKGNEIFNKIKIEQEKKLNERIEKVFNSTGINMEEKSNAGYGGFGETGWVCPLVELKNIGVDQEGVASKKQLNLTEAHEKGHGIRHFNENSLIGKWIISSLDFSNIKVSEKDLEFLKSRTGTKNKTDQEIIDFYIINGLKKNPDEIIERMSQLRNYFGMKGDEEFTKEHLVYAKINYIKDTGWPLQIRPFLDAITESSENNFLDVINNLGV